MEQYSKDTINKIGNAMVYMANHIPYGISKTKMQKLLYILEELSVAIRKCPFFGISFEVWKFGPVFKDLYYDVTHEDDMPMFSEFIKVENTENGTFLKPNKEFKDDEFSDYDIDIMDHVIKKLRDTDAASLIKYTHRDGSPWDIAVKENGLKILFDSGVKNTTDIKIDFSLLLDNDCDIYIFNEISESKRVLESLK